MLLLEAAETKKEVLTQMASSNHQGKLRILSSAHNRVPTDESHRYNRLRGPTYVMTRSECSCNVLIVGRMCYQAASCE